MKKLSQIRAERSSFRKPRGAMFDAGFTLIELMIVITIILIHYTLDKQAAPQSLDDLVQAGYLRKVPVDQITGGKDWVPQFDSVVLSPDQTSTGMVDVHSNATKVSPFDNTPYNEW